MFHAHYLNITSAAAAIHCQFPTPSLNDQPNAGSEMMIMWCPVRANTCPDSNAGCNKDGMTTSRMTWQKLRQNQAPVLSTKYFISCHLILIQASISVFEQCKTYNTTTKLSNSVLQWDRYTFLFSSSVDKFLQATVLYKSLRIMRCSNFLASSKSAFVL